MKQIDFNILLEKRRNREYVRELKHWILAGGIVILILLLRGQI